MITAKLIETQEHYKGKSVRTIARRLFGTTVRVRLEANTAFNPGYQIYTVVGKGGIVMGRLYTEDEQPEEEED